MIDVNQEIKWANTAALAMHGVQSHGELGRTIDEYHANFQVKFRGAPPSSDRAVESLASGESFRDVIIEVTPLGGCRPHWVYRVRNLVLVDDSGHPTCIVLVIRPLQELATAAQLFSARLDRLPNAAALVRCADRKFAGANDAFLALAGIDRAMLNEQSARDTILCDGLDAAGEAGDEFHPSLSFVALPEAGDAAGLAIAGCLVEHASQPCILYSVLDTHGVQPHRLSAGAGHDAAIDDAAAFCASSPAPICVLDESMTVTAVSQAFLDWLAYTEEEVLGRKLTAFMAEPVADHFRSHTWPDFTHCPRVRDLKCTFVTKAGAVLKAVVAATARLDRHGRPVQVVAAPVDVTDRTHAEDGFAAMFALSPVPMLIRKLDDNRILDANDAFMAATGYDATTVIGHGTDEFGIFDGRASRQHFESAARSEEGVKDAEGHLKTSHGDVLDCLVSARKVHAFGRICLLMVLQDISDRRRNETQLYEAIETVMKDSSWFSRSVIEKLATLRSPPRSGSRAAEIGDLTPREREVLGFISHGLADTDIAQKLGLTRSTVRNHVATLYSKIGVHSRSSAIIWARERGINMAWPVTQAANYARSPLSPGKSGPVAMVQKNRRA